MKLVQKRQLIGIGIIVSILFLVYIVFFQEPNLTFFSLEWYTNPSSYKIEYQDVTYTIIELNWYPRPLNTSSSDFYIETSNNSSIEKIYPIIIFMGNNHEPINWLDKEYYQNGTQIYLIFPNNSPTTLWLSDGGQIPFDPPSSLMTNGTRIKLENLLSTIQ